MTGTTRTGGAAGLRAATDPAVVTAALAELANSAPAALATERTAIEGSLSGVFTAAGDTLDLTLPAVAALEGFSGTVADRATKIVDLHSRLAAVAQLEGNYHRATEIRADIQRSREDANRSVFDDPTYRGEVARVVRQTVTDRMLASLQEQHGTQSFAEAYRASGGSLRFEHEFDTTRYLAAVVTTAAGWDPFVERQPGDTPAISRPLQVYQTIPMSMTDQHSIKYMVQTTRTATAIVEKAEGAASGEAVMAWTERTENMREIPGHIPITEIQLEDEPQIRAIVDMDLRLMVMQRMDGQLVSGDAANQTADDNIAGIQAWRGGTADVNKPVPFEWAATSSVRNDQIDDAKKAKTKLILTGRVMPNRYYFHHEIWDEISLSETTAAGYYLGSPATAFQEMLWGLPVTPTDHLSSATASNTVGGMLVDNMYMRIWCRRALHSEIGLNSDDFTKRQLTIRAAVRCCLQVRRPQAVLLFDMP